MGIKLSCPGGDSLLVKVKVDGQPRTAFLDSNSSLTFVKAGYIAAHKGLSTEISVRLETMNGQITEYLRGGRETLLANAATLP